MKCTFKRHGKEKSLASVAQGVRSVDIKVDGLVVGYIQAPNWPIRDGKWRIQIAVKRFEHYKWTTSGCLYDTEEESRLAAPSVLDAVASYYTIHKFEE